MQHKPYKSKVLPSMQRVLLGIGLLLILGSLYLYFYFFWKDFAYWGSESNVENLYIRYVWIIILVIAVLVPFILTLTRIKTRYWVVSWLTGICIALISWALWYYFL